VGWRGADEVKEGAQSSFEKFDRKLGACHVSVARVCSPKEVMKQHSTLALVVWMLVSLVSSSVMAKDSTCKDKGGKCSAKAKQSSHSTKKSKKSDKEKSSSKHGSGKKEKRRGPNPCLTPDPGFGVYDKWEGVSTGQMVAPQRGGIRKSGGFDLIVHFHGHEPIRKEFVKTGRGVVLVGIDLGIGSGAYSSTFSDPSRFVKLIKSVEEKMKKRTGNSKAHVQHLALSSWSAGYGALQEILLQPAGKKVEALIMLDSLHTGYKEGTTNQLKTQQIEQFVAFAKRASRKQRFMFMSHSSIIPPGYASTTEVAHYMVGELHGKMKKASRQDVLGLDMINRYDRGNFHVRGYTGNDKPDHCAHIGLMKDVLAVHIVPKWRTPKGFIGKAKTEDDHEKSSKKGTHKESSSKKRTKKHDKKSHADKKSKKKSKKKSDNEGLAFHHSRVSVFCSGGAFGLAMLSVEQRGGNCGF
jgi:hypothetical protein